MLLDDGDGQRYLRACQFYQNCDADAEQTNDFVCQNYDEESRSFVSGPTYVGFGRIDPGIVEISPGL